MRQAGRNSSTPTSRQSVGDGVWHGLRNPSVVARDLLIWGMSFFTLLGPPNVKRPRLLAGDRFAVYGRVARGPLLLGRADLDGMPSGKHTPDVAAYARGETGKALGLRAIIDSARPAPGTLYVNFEDRAGRHRISHFLTEVQDLGWIAYAAVDGIRSLEQSGPFRRILPGIPTERGRMSDLASIEFGDEARE